MLLQTLPQRRIQVMFDLVHGLLHLLLMLCLRSLKLLQVRLHLLGTLLTGASQLGKIISECLDLVILGLEPGFNWSVRGSGLWHCCGCRGRHLWFLISTAKDLGTSG